MDRELKLAGEKEPRCMHSAIEAIHDGKPFTFGLKQNPKDCVQCSWYELEESMRESNSWPMIQVKFGDEVAGDTGEYIVEIFPNGIDSIQGKSESLPKAIRNLIDELSDFLRDQNQ